MPGMLYLMTHPTECVRVCDDCAKDAIAPQFSGYQAQAYASPLATTTTTTTTTAAHTRPQDQLIDGPPLPPLAPLPAFPEPGAINKLQGGQANMADLLSLGFNAMAVAQSHHADPHLSQQDNALKLGGNLRSAIGITSQENQLSDALAQLESSHLPEGLAGFVLTQAPSVGTLGHQHGLRPYDLIYQFESVLVRLLWPPLLNSFRCPKKLLKRNFRPRCKPPF